MAIARIGQTTHELVGRGRTVRRDEDDRNDAVSHSVELVR